jgi:hypothetical protein
MKRGNLQGIKNKGMLLLATIMLFKAFLAPAVFIDFKLNQDYIVKVLCINREKPQLECEGQCILMQKMKSTQDHEGPEQSQSPKTQLLEIFSELTSLFQPLSFPSSDQAFFMYDEEVSSENFSRIFHPPKISIL